MAILYFTRKKVKGGKRKDYRKYVIELTSNDNLIIPTLVKIIHPEKNCIKVNKKDFEITHKKR